MADSKKTAVEPFEASADKTVLSGRKDLAWYQDHRVLSGVLILLSLLIVLSWW